MWSQWSGPYTSMGSGFPPPVRFWGVNPYFGGVLTWSTCFCDILLQWAGWSFFSLKKEKKLICCGGWFGGISSQIPEITCGFHRSTQRGKGELTPHYASRRRGFSACSREFCLQDRFLGCRWVHRLTLQGALRKAVFCLHAEVSCGDHGYSSARYVCLSRSFMLLFL